MNKLLEKITNSLADAKAQDIVTFNIEGRSSLADYIIIASGTSHRHVRAVAERLLREIKNSKIKITPKVEGLTSCDWVLLDVGDIIVHIFRPEVREFYCLEKIWQVLPNMEKGEQ